MSASPLLEVSALTVTYGQKRHAVRAVDGVDVIVQQGESVGLVGESGCGKTTLGRAIMRLLPIQAGRISFAGQDITSMTRRQLAAYRKQVQMVFQDPYGSLNARMAVGQALEEVMLVHGEKDPAARRQQAADLFQRVGLDPAYLDRYPHEFSGGQRQRIGIARALAVGPQLLIADEPVSALDVSVQVQILNLLKTLRQQMDLTYLFIAHDLAVVRYVCDRILVMYQGRIVESGPPDQLFTAPAHPYTRTLLAAVPDVDG
jgi:peptide/nickel transport system ATP-binding protein